MPRLKLHRYRLRRFITYTIILLLTGIGAQAQFSNNANKNGQPRDTSMNKSNNSNWHNEHSKTEYTYINSDEYHTPDTSIHTFHRRPFSQPWQRDLGNLGGPARNLFFTPEYRTGPTLGYYITDAYRFKIDSLLYYNTNKPYSVFGFQLGSKLEQMAHIMLTENLRPNWNFAVEYNRITSPGQYLIQRTSGDYGAVSTHHKSRNNHYELYGGLVYNKATIDENGGYLYDSLLNDPAYNDRRTLSVAYQNDGYGGSGVVQRSSVTNMVRDFSAMVQHSYTFGKTDTLYNEDSTHIRTQLTPRFGITHRFDYTSARRLFKDVRPDSLRYAAFFNHGFASSDSLYSRQGWEKIDNRLLLNGFIGKYSNQLKFNAGIGSRIDNFQTFYLFDLSNSKYTSTYLTGEIKKEAVERGQWYVSANAQVYMSGAMAGNSELKAVAGKRLKNDWARIEAGLSQNINNAPYSYTTYYNQYDTITTSFNKESVTQLYAIANSNKYHATAGFRSYLISNYIYTDAKQQPAQYATAFNVTQLWLRKMFVWHALTFDNELVYQQAPAAAPVNIPALMGRHQLGIETYVLKKALKIATGIEVRYHSPYDPAGYSPLFDRFYYQNTYSVNNKPEGSVFFNFKIKNFRAYLMGDQLQQLFWRNTIISKGYAAQNAMIRFGFAWVLIN